MHANDTILRLARPSYRLIEKMRYFELSIHLSSIDINKLLWIQQYALT